MTLILASFGLSLQQTPFLRTAVAPLPSPRLSSSVSLSRPFVRTVLLVPTRCEGR